MPSVTSPSVSGRRARVFAFGSSARKPAAMSGVTIMKMIRSTSMMSIIGTTFGSDLTDVRPALPVDMLMGRYLLSESVMPASASHMAAAGNRLLRLELLREDRPAELAADALDEVVDELLRRVRHLDRQVLDLGGEVVVRPHGRDGGHEA